jgi:hypothetical protein
MQRQLSSFLIGSFAILSASQLIAADSLSPGEVKLRETLRNTMLQLRTAETERATLQAAQAENDAKLKDAIGKLDALTKERTADREAAEKMINSLKTKETEHEAEIAKLKEVLLKWQAAQKEATDLAATKEAERAKLAGEKIVLQRHVAEQQAKNDTMFKLGNEILTRYEKFGLGDALTAREPFVGMTRVKFQNLMQDYSDKLTDQKLKP